MLQRDRKIGLPLAMMLVAGNTIGSGIFLLPATLAAIGSITLIAWILAAGGAMLIALVLARIGQIDPEAGGPCAYARIALGRYMGFQSSALYWISCLVANVAIATAAIGYLADFWPRLAVPQAAALASVALLWMLVIANILGPRFVCQLESATTYLVLVPIAIVIFAGWWHFSPHVFAASWNVSGASPLHTIPQTLVLVFFAFQGLESASIATAVVENPRRNVAPATVGGVAIAAIVYIACCAVIMGLMPAAALARSTAPFADAIRIVLGRGAAATVAALALAKVATMLGGWILVTAQVSKSAADSGLMPALLGRTDRKQVPVPGLLVAGVLMTACALVTISPTLGSQFGQLVAASSVLCMLIYFYACLAMWHYAPRGQAGARRDHSVAIAAGICCVAVTLLSGATLLKWTAAIVLLTVPVYALQAAKRRKLATATPS